MLTGFDLCRAAMAAPGVSATERSVLMVLAIMAGKEDARCWPPINDTDDGVAGLTTRCVLSERAVQRAIQQLVRLGHITRKQLRHGVIYTVHPAIEATPATVTGVVETGDSLTGDGEAARPATQAPKLPKTTTLPKVERKREPVGSTVPLDFAPVVKADSITGKAMAGWPPGVVAEQVEHFIDRHSTQGTKSLDWQASWRTWVKNWKRFNGNRPTHDRSEPQNPMVRAVRRAEARRAGHDSSGIQPRMLA